MTGDDLKRYREQAGWSVRQMAAYFDVSKSAYSRYESGDRQIPDKLISRIEKTFLDFNGVLSLGIDYLRLNFNGLSPREVVQDVLKMPLDDFMSGGGNSSMGYRTSLNYAGFMYIRIFGRGENIEEIGALVQMSGRGVRAFEYVLERADRSWEDFLYAALLEYGGNVTRADFAINDYVGWFDMQELVDKSFRGEYKSRFRSPHEIHGNQFTGWTLDFGRRNNVFFRFYEKSKEIAGRLGTLDYEYGIMNRYELMVGDGRKADQLIRDWVLRDDLVGQVYGYFNRYILFTVDTYDPDSDDEPEVWEPWHYFVKEAKTVKFETAPEQVDLEKTFSWLQNSVAGSLKALLRVHGIDAVYRMVLEGEMSDKTAKAVAIIKQNIEEENERAKLAENFYENAY
ncbi:replication initiation factor domain-containing protein [Weissella confusa]|uniref:replication initiation factor domain-containing protein n=1 Tax=Weissella confusa TaxID=1583 RepID=UPI001C6FBDFA|nr:replication initiation factor domain-containing protein [Weissella confusa]QYU58833.1 replication initiation factor domain-containing protein [Weissella confusa]